MFDITHSHLWLDSFTCVTWSIYTRGTNDLYAWHDTGRQRCIKCLNCRSLSSKEPLMTGLFWGKWRIKIRHPMGFRRPLTLAQLWLFAHLCVSVCVCVCLCDLTCAHVWHDSFMCVTWLLHTHESYHGDKTYNTLTHFSFFGLVAHRDNM